MSDSDEDMSYDDKFMPGMANNDIEATTGIEDIIDNPLDTAKTKKKKYGSFGTMGLLESLVTAIKERGYNQPTPIQRKVIPMILTGSDIIAMARTGSGKTLAFSVPLVNRLREHSTAAGARALVVSPARELAQQTYKYILSLTEKTDLRTAVITGGDDLNHHFDQLSGCPDIIVATPGRLLHILQETGMNLSRVEYLVLDEADRLLEMGFQTELEQIVKSCSPNRQTLLFSATLPKLLVEFSRAGLKNPEMIRLDADAQLSEHLGVAFFSVRAEEKPAALLALLKDVLRPNQQAIVFTATKSHVEYLHSLLDHHGISNSLIYGKMDGSARKINLAVFTKKRTQVLLVTDVAARGIDIPQLDVVINYDFPDKSKLFVHRVGRTARAGRSGAAYNLLQQDELPYLIDLQWFLSSTKLQSTVNNIQNCVHGKFPPLLLQYYTEQIAQLHLKDVSLDIELTSVKNSLKLYRKTRSPPSRQALGKAKEMLRTSENGFIPLEVHPLLAHLTTSEETSAQDFVASLRNYRPKETIFEVKRMASHDMMTLKRIEQTKFIDMAKAHRALMKQRKERENRKEADLSESDDSEPEEDDFDPPGSDSEDEAPAKKKRKVTSSFADNKFFLGYRQEDYHTEKGMAINNAQETNLEDAMLDLNPDDDRSIFRKRTQMKWDHRKRKYIKVDNDADKTKIYIKNEAGQKIKSLVDQEGKHQTGKYYKDWMAKTNKRIPLTGEDAGLAVPVKARLHYKEAQPNTEAVEEDWSGDEAPHGKKRKFSDRQGEDRRGGRGHSDAPRGRGHSDAPKGRGGGGFGRGSSTGRGGSQGGRGRGGKPEKKARNELKSHADIQKARAETAKRNAWQKKSKPTKGGGKKRK